MEVKARADSFFHFFNVPSGTCLHLQMWLLALQQEDLGVVHAAIAPSSVAPWASGSQGGWLRGPHCQRLSACPRQQVGAQAASSQETLLTKPAASAGLVLRLEARRYWGLCSGLSSPHAPTLPHLQPPAAACWDAGGGASWDGQCCPHQRGCFCLFPSCITRPFTEEAAALGM